MLRRTFLSLACLALAATAAGAEPLDVLTVTGPHVEVGRRAAVVRFQVGPYAAYRGTVTLETAAGEPIAFALVGAGTDYAVPFRGLTPGTAYRVTVKVMNPNTGRASAVAMFATPAR